MWPWWVKIPTEDFTDKSLVINDNYGSCAREIVVLIMEVDKVADEVTEMEVDKGTDMKIPIEDLTYVILAIGDIYRDDVRSGWQVGRHVELIQVMQPVSQVFF